MNVPRFCTQCGQVVKQLSPSRFLCPEGHISYLNPLPVVVLLVRQRVPEKGLLVVKRKLPPMAGKWALPSGFVEYGQTVEQACSAELKQETGVLVEPSSWNMFTARSTPSTGEILMFYSCPVLDDVLAYFEANDEVIEIGVTGAGSIQLEDLCFPLHQEVAGGFISTQDMLELERLRPLP